MVLFQDGGVICHGCETWFAHPSKVNDEGYCALCQAECRECGQPLPRDDEFVARVERDGVVGSICADCRSVNRAMKVQVQAPQMAPDERTTAFKGGVLERDTTVTEVARERAVERIVSQARESAVANGRRPQTGTPTTYCLKCYLELPLSGQCGDCDE